MAGDGEAAHSSYPKKAYRQRSLGSDRPFITEILRVFVTRMTVFLAVTAIVFGAVLYHMMSAVKIYRASSELLIERQSSRLGNFDDPLMVDTFDNDYYQTQFRILQGTGLQGRAAKALGLAPQGVHDADAAGSLGGSPEVLWPRNSRIVEVAYYHHDGAMAAAIVNAIVREYKRDMVGRRQDAISELSDQMQARLEKVKKDLKDSEDALIAFYTQKKLPLGEGKQSVFQRLLDDTSAAWVRESQALAWLEIIGARIEEAGDSVEKLAAVLAGENRGLRPDLQMEYLRAAGALKEAQQKYQEGHPDRIAAEAREKQVLAKVEEEIRLQASALLSERNARRESLAKTREAFEDFRNQVMEQNSLLMQAGKLESERNAYRQLYDSLILRIKEAEISQGLQATNVYVLGEATPPGAPISPSWPVSLLVALITGLVAGGTMTLLLENLDNSVRTPEDIELPYGLPVLTVVPQRRPDGTNAPTAVVCWQDERSQVAEAYRRLRASILLSLRDDQGGSIRKILVVSPGSSEGKTVTATNLAITFAQMGSRTLFIDTDFYMSETAKLFELDDDRGLSTLLTTDVGVAQAVQQTPVPCLDFMATGLVPPQPASLLASARMKWLLDEASRTYQRVVIDTSPLMAVTDGTLLAPHVDAIVLVVSQGKTQKAALRRVMQTFQRIGARPLGFVFNNVKMGVGEFYMKYPRSSELSEPPAPEPAAPSGKAN